MAIALALFAALAYGVSDFVGGLISRRASAWAVAVLANLSSTVCGCHRRLRARRAHGDRLRLYPASTVLLAALILHERVRRAQGLGLCAATVGSPVTRQSR